MEDAHRLINVKTRGDQTSNEQRVIPTELCQAFRDGCQKTMQAKIDIIEAKVEGLRNTIVAALSISTAIISLVVLLVNLMK